MPSCFICRDADAGSSGCLSSTISCPLLDACCILTQNRRFRLRISTRFGSNKRFMGQTLVADKHTPMHPVSKRGEQKPLATTCPIGLEPHSFIHPTWCQDISGPLRSSLAYAAQLKHEGTPRHWSTQRARDYGEFHRGM